MFKQTLIFVAILTIPFLWIPFTLEFDLNTGTIGPPKAEEIHSEEDDKVKYKQGVLIDLAEQKPENQAEDHEIIRSKPSIDSIELPE